MSIIRILSNRAWATSFSGVLLAGCAAIGGIEDVSYDPNLDNPQGGSAGSTGGSSGNGGASANAGTAGAGAGGSGGCGAVLFVSPMGKDSNDGCTEKSPVQTVSKAIELASGGQYSEMHICSGEYTEKQPLVLLSDVSIWGGYDCATWERMSGALSKNLENNTNIKLQDEADLSAEHGATLSISGAQTRSVVIEGVTIIAPDTKQVFADGNGAAALRITGEANPTIRSSVLRAGHGTKSFGRSVGLLIESGAGAEVDHVMALGSDCEGGSSGAMITIAESKSVKIHDSYFVGGMLTTDCDIDWPAVGLILKVENKINPANEFYLNWFDGGTSERTTDCSADSNTVAAIHISGGGAMNDLTLHDNIIYAGNSKASGNMVGLYSTMGGRLIAYNNRIFGGAVDDDNSELNTFGIKVQTSQGDGAVELVNNLIHGGNNTSKIVRSATAVYLEKLTGFLLYNSIFAGGLANSATSTAIGLHGGSGGTQLTLAANLLFAPPRTQGSSRAIYLEQCADIFPNARYNLLLSGADLLAFAPSVSSACNNGGNAAVTVEEAQLLVDPNCASNPSACAATGWRLLAKSCTSAATCVPITPCDGTTQSLAACMGTLYSNFGADLGVEGLVGDRANAANGLPENVAMLGWQLGKIPCIIAEGVEEQISLSDLTNKDIYSVSRPTPATPGAQQASQCMGPP